MSNKTVEINVSEYEMLKEQAEKYQCLKACGVDNWQDYGEAMKMYEEGDE